MNYENVKKRHYAKPRMEVVVMDSEGILCTSLTVGSGSSNAYNDGGVFQSSSRGNGGTGSTKAYSNKGVFSSSLRN